MNKENTDHSEGLLERGIANIYPSKEFIASKIARGEKLTIYLGVDPTGPDLHLGHAIPLKKLAEFQKMGHKIILLMGDFTAMIGDPTDKSSARVQLTRKQVLANLKNYKKQASKILSFSGKNSAKIMFNSKWLGKMKFEDVLSLASEMTVQQMLERDMFEKRIADGKPIFIHEFMYPLMQGYDSVAMNVDGEIGGNDQTFNMLCGRNLMKSINQKEKFVITMKLLEDGSGKKMGKTEGNMITLSDTADTMYGKVMSWTDGLILPGFELCTNATLFDLQEIARDLADGAVNPRDLKMRLAREVAGLYHGEAKALQAEVKFINAFQNHEIPADILSVSNTASDLLADIILRNNLVSSKSEWNRLVESGAVTNLRTSQKVTDPKIKAESTEYRIGKTRFIRIQ